MKLFILLILLNITILFSSNLFVKANNQVGCEICEMVTTFLEDKLANSNVETNISEELMKLCNYIPSNYQTICNNLIENNIDSIIKSFENNETPTIICDQLGLCSQSSSSSSNFDTIQETSSSSSSSSSSDLPSVGCLICEFIVQKVESYIEVNATQSEIEYFLDQDCNKFGGGYAGECVVYVNQYVPQLVNYLSYNQKPEKACSEIKACPSSSF
ncbi:hypothetical protein DDB_G0268890 [Dictyostelium discoideum AX4]|uniref:Saposin B-type domain-containing protein n=1 Tax=Dictyostelium discoideum TaxID=44689 RepID=Q55EI1_DICDI|nr:hypothetical protein DDB_G0268890 [Dictyostelium discoideum AX4]EAL73034.1 hypothetical protein DDB_G0268890 [Dictyostelium discoideum AX4]|eukprot:XP_647039.1 hypothetical protein DDB_G0268890 [Dictyostelium discoideum AX4]